MCTITLLAAIKIHLLSSLFYPATILFTKDHLETTQKSNHCQKHNLYTHEKKTLFKNTLFKRCNFFLYLPEIFIKLMPRALKAWIKNNICPLYCISDFCGSQHYTHIYTSHSLSLSAYVGSHSGRGCMC